MYFQPLPLFDVQNLTTVLESSPRFLRWIFLAAALKFTSHPHYRGSEKQAVELYVTTCRNVVTELASAGTLRLDVLRSLCLLALVDIYGKSIDPV